MLSLQLGGRAIQVQTIYLKRLVVLADWKVLGCRREEGLHILLILGALLLLPDILGRLENFLSQLFLAGHGLQLPESAVKFLSDDDRCRLISHLRLDVNQAILYKHIMAALSLLEECHWIRHLPHLCDSRVQDMWKSQWW